MRHWRSGILPVCVEWNKKLLSASRMGEPITSVLPSNEREQYTTVIADEAALLELASCYLTGTGVSQPNPNLINTLVVSTMICTPN